MTKSKNQNLSSEAFPKAESKIQNPKSKIRWLLICLLAIVLVIFLLFYRPAYYKPAITADDTKQISTYLIFQLLPQFYNGVQLQEPFDLVVTQQGVNEMLSNLPLPSKSQGIDFSSSVVIFSPDKISLAARAAYAGANVIVTFEIAPGIDAKGLLNVKLAKVKVGAMTVTSVACVIARKRYEEGLRTKKVKPADIRNLIAASLFENKPFDPVFTIDDKKVRLDKVTVTDGKLLLHFTPATSASETVMLKF